VNHYGVTKNVHWYPGTFPSQLPATLIQALSKSNDLIFDPYGGIGTTASESLRLQRKAWLVDINPIGVLANYQYASMMLLYQLSEEKFNYLFNYIDSMLESNKASHAGLFHNYNDPNIPHLDRLIDKYIRPCSDSLISRVRKSNPIWPELKPWIHRNTLRELKYLHELFLSAQPGNIYNIFIGAMVSANLRAISSQNKSWGHIADNVYPKEYVMKDIASKMKTWLRLLYKNITNINYERDARISGIQYWIDIHDWRSDQEPSVKPYIKPNLIITSPPYGDAIDYIKSQKLSLYYFGYTQDDIHKMCDTEIGARRKRFRTDSRARWANQITESAIKHASYIHDGLMVIILPHKNHGRQIGINSLEEGMIQNGWEKIFQVDRSINQKKARQSWTSIKKETISIFSRG
jgi:hypothetical protein